MIDDLGPKGKRAWVFLDAVSGNALSIAQLYDAYTVGALDDLQERMADVDLEPHVLEWLTVIRSHLAQHTIDHYELYVRSLVPADKRVPRSYLTQERLVQWLARSSRWWHSNSGTWIPRWLSESTDGSSRASRK